MIVSFGENYAQRHEDKSKQYGEDLKLPSSISLRVCMNIS